MKAKDENTLNTNKDEDNAKESNQNRKKFLNRVAMATALVGVTGIVSQNVPQMKKVQARLMFSSPLKTTSTLKNTFVNSSGVARPIYNTTTVSGIKNTVGKLNSTVKVPTNSSTSSVTNSTTPVKGVVQNKVNYYNSLSTSSTTKPTTTVTTTTSSNVVKAPAKPIATTTTSTTASTKPITSTSTSSTSGTKTPTKPTTTTSTSTTTTTTPGKVTNTISKFESSSPGRLPISTTPSSTKIPTATSPTKPSGGTGATTNTTQSTGTTSSTIPITSNKTNSTTGGAGTKPTLQKSPSTTSTSSTTSTGSSGSLKGTLVTQHSGGGKVQLNSSGNSGSSSGKVTNSTQTSGNNGGLKPSGSVSSTTSSSSSGKGSVTGGVSGSGAGKPNSSSGLNKNTGSSNTTRLNSTTTNTTNNQKPSGGKLQKVMAIVGLATTGAFLATSIVGILQGQESMKMQQELQNQALEAQKELAEAQQTKEYEKLAAQLGGTYLPEEGVILLPDGSKLNVLSGIVTYPDGSWVDQYGNLHMGDGSGSIGSDGSININGVGTIDKDGNLVLEDGSGYYDPDGNFHASGQISTIKGISGGAGYGGMFVDTQFGGSKVINQSDNYGSIAYDKSAYEKAQIKASSHSSVEKGVFTPKEYDSIINLILSSKINENVAKQMNQDGQLTSEQLSVVLDLLNTFNTSGKI